MTCTEFLARFSEFYDGDPPIRDSEAFEAHVAACPSCSRYVAVLQRGVELLRELPPSPVRDDFRDRLRYSIYRFDEERRRERNTFGASRVMLVVAAAAALAAVFGAPVVWSADPSVELEPIVAQRPAGEPTPHALPSASPARDSPWFGSSDLWSGSNVLLYEHSSLYQRSREPGLVRAGLR